MKKKAQLIIELQSDLCAGSGYSYAGTIDSDVVSDDYGFPYIPARRIKGCLKEAAEMIRITLSEDAITFIFGKRGSRNPGNLVVGNACLCDYDELLRQASSLKTEYSKDAILRQFTSVRAQIKIDDQGIAENNMLRYVRVVNKESPIDNGEPLRFYSEIQYDDQYEKDLEKIVKALRGIGLNRNRGFGRVHCELKVLEETPQVKQVFSEITDCSDGDKTVLIPYSLRNTAPLMLSLGIDNKSETYIPGRMVLGALAGKYLSLDGTNADSDEFKDIFLNGKTRFLNAYVRSSSGTRMTPVPKYINRLKKTKKLVNVMRRSEESENKKQTNSENDKQHDDYCVTVGNQPKKIDGKYYTLSEGKVELREIDMQLVYHHRNKHGDEPEQLYSQLVVSANQVFSGEIMTTAKRADRLCELLTQGELYLGKSKTAQYGRCVVDIDKDINHVASGVESEPVTIEKGIILVSFDSPGIFVGPKGETVAFSDVYSMVASDLGIKDAIKLDEQGDGYELPVYEGIKPYSVLDTKLIYGYQSVWNLRRPPIPAISEGSTLVYILKEDCEISKRPFVGSMNLEGYGEVTVRSLEDVPYKLDEKTKDEAKEKTLVKGKFEILFKKIETEKKIRVKYEEIQNAANQEKLNALSASALGRVTLMLKEALSQYEEPKAQYLDYQKRIESIKTKSVRECMERFAKQWKPDDLDESIQAYWGEILLQGLTCKKYNKKTEKNDGTVE